MAGIDFLTVAGSKLFISSAAPTVAEGSGAAAAFALLTWVEVGQITNVGSIEGREYAKSEMKTVGDAQSRSKKESFSLPDADFESAWAPDDAGQILVKAASKNNSVPSFKLEDQDGTLNYFTAQVSKYTRSGGGADDSLKGNMTLLRQTDTVTV